MIIRNNTIFFKSDDDFYFKEEIGIKPNTVRFFHDLNEIRDMVRFAIESLTEEKYIEISNVKNPMKSFRRTIRDITQFHVFGTRYWIITWNPIHDVPCIDIEKCKWVMAAAEAH
jgi:hypothetical protein